MRLNDRISGRRSCGIADYSLFGELVGAVILGARRSAVNATPGGRTVGPVLDDDVEGDELVVALT